MYRSDIFNSFPEYNVKMGEKTYRCSIGKGGIREDKKEGDGATPVGEFTLRRIFYRADRINFENIKTKLPVQALSPDDGWCDDVNYSEYNTYVKLPFSGSHEKLWRQGHLYDLIVVVGYNDNPVEKGKGSAIFIHIAREGYQPTAGCVAFQKEDLLEILSRLTPETLIKISKSGDMEFENYLTHTVSCMRF